VVRPFETVRAKSVVLLGTRSKTLISIARYDWFHAIGRLDPQARPGDDGNLYSMFRPNHMPRRWRKRSSYEMSFGYVMKTICQISDSVIVF